jgi:hypothetical protein
MATSFRTREKGKEWNGEPVWSSIVPGRKEVKGGAGEGTSRRLKDKKAGIWR